MWGGWSGGGAQAAIPLPLPPVTQSRGLPSTFGAGGAAGGFASEPSWASDAPRHAERAHVHWQSKRGPGCARWGAALGWKGCGEVPLPQRPNAAHPRGPCGTLPTSAAVSTPQTSRPWESLHVKHRGEAAPTSRGTTVLRSVSVGLWADTSTPPLPDPNHCVPPEASSGALPEP